MRARPVQVASAPLTYDDMSNVTTLHIGRKWRNCIYMTTARSLYPLESRLDSAVLCVTGCLNDRENTFLVVPSPIPLRLFFRFSPWLPTPLLRLDGMSTRSLSVM